MNERIKEIRKALNLTQQEFADRLKIKRGTLANYEIGRNEPIGAIISVICREFNVNEDWLRSGKGEMFIPGDDGILERLTNEYKLTKREQAVIASFLGLPDADRAAVVRYIEDIAKKLMNAETAAELMPQLLPQPEPAMPDVMSMLAELQRQNAELLRQNEELMRRDAKRSADIEAIKEVDKLTAIASGSFDSIPHSSGSSDMETTKQVDKQTTAHQYEH